MGSIALTTADPALTLGKSFYDSDAGLTIAPL